jgi:hypothetical protein
MRHDRQMRQPRNCGVVLPQAVQPPELWTQKEPEESKIFNFSYVALLRPPLEKGTG